MLSIDELSGISVAVQATLNDRLDEILIKLNRTGQLDTFLSLIGIDDLIESPRNKEGTIIVIGQSEVEKGVLAAVAKDFGIEKNRFEFYLDYDDAERFRFEKTQWSNAYSVILVGEMPHSGRVKGNYSSMITALENEPGYPPVVRVGTSRMKITKSSFRETLEYLRGQGLL